MPADLDYMSEATRMFSQDTLANYEQQQAEEQLLSSPIYALPLTNDQKWMQKNIGMFQGMVPKSEEERPFDPTRLIKFREVNAKQDGSKSYLDSEGKLTGGIGHLMTPAEQKLYPNGTPIPEKLRAEWFRTDLNTAMNAAFKQGAELGVQDNQELMEVLVSMNFQNGTSWYKDVIKPNGEIKTGHKKTWNYMKEGKWLAAAGEAPKSKWFKQTPERTRDLQQALIRQQVREDVQSIRK